MPDKHSAWLEHPRELFNHAQVFFRIEKEPKRCKKIHYCVESAAPALWQLSHVAAYVSQCRTSSAFFRELDEMFGVVETINIKACFRQEMSVSALSTGHIENARSRRKAENIDQSRDFVPVTLRREDRLVLQQIV